MEIIILGFCVILLGIYGSKAMLMHRGYSHQLYSRLFGSYLEYFFRNAIRHDCSTSTLVKSKLGTHKMSFTTIQNHEGQVTSHFVILFYNKGIALITYLHPDGMLEGKVTDKNWMITRNNKKFKIANPMVECKKYSERIRKYCPTLTVQEYIAVSDETNLQKMNGSIYHYSELLDTLKAVNLPYINEELIVSEYQKLSEKKG